MPAWFYMLRLRSTRLYCGSTTNRDHRYKEHFSGQGSRTTKIDLPIAVAYAEEFNTFKEAYRREQQVKRWSRSKKEARISGDTERLKVLSKRKR
jgi:putative endonuclease